jgi:Protein of unknown function (DUF3363)
MPPQHLQQIALHDGAARQVIGRLITYGLDDELKESVYAVVDEVDGSVHHLRLPDLNALGDAKPGRIVGSSSCAGSKMPQAQGVRLWLCGPTCRSTNR